MKRKIYQKIIHLCGLLGLLCCPLTSLATESSTFADKSAFNHSDSELSTDIPATTSSTSDSQTSTTEQLADKVVSYDFSKSDLYPTYLEGESASLDDFIKLIAELQGKSYQDYYFQPGSEPNTSQIGQHQTQINCLNDKGTEVCFIMSYLVSSRTSTLMVEISSFDRKTMLLRGKSQPAVQISIYSEKGLQEDTIKTDDEGNFDYTFKEAPKEIKIDARDQNGSRGETRYYLNNPKQSSATNDSTSQTPFSESESVLQSSTKAALQTEQSQAPQPSSGMLAANKEERQTSSWPLIIILLIGLTGVLYLVYRSKKKAVPPKE